MNTKKNKSPEDILNSLDRSQRAAAPDFFYTRLKARMLAEMAGSGKKYDNNYNRSWVLRPAFALVALFLILLINVAIVFRAGEVNETGNADTETIQQSIASEYSISDSNSLYDLNTDK